MFLEIFWTAYIPIAMLILYLIQESLIRSFRQLLCPRVAPRTSGELGAPIHQGTTRYSSQKQPLLVLILRVRR